MEEDRNKVNSSLFAVAMPSVPRNESYLFLTLATLFMGSTTLPMNLPVDLFIGKEKGALQFYKPLRALQRVNLHYWEQDIVNRLSNNGIDDIDHKQLTRVIARLNYGRVLAHFVKNADSSSSCQRGLLIIEDDTLMGNNGLERLEKTIELIESEGNTYEYLLDCYVVNFSELARSKFSDAVDVRLGTYTCSQCLYIPKGLVKSLSAHVNNVDWWSIPYDLAVDEYSKDRSIPIFAMRKSIVQHIGKYSTGLTGWGFHTSNRFE
eukprot:CFRG1808T1